MAAKNEECFSEEMHSSDLSSDEFSEEEDSSDSSSSEEVDEDNEETLILLENNVTGTQQYDYSAHVELITLLRKKGELERLRRARERMSSTFPLSEELWLEWIKDEMNIATESDRPHINNLFETAISDYLCAGVWAEYVQYCIGNMAVGGLDKIREVFERALSAIGIHITKGSIIWETYRVFESAILTTLQPQPGSILTGAKQKEIDTQIERIATLFKRQLSIPLTDMENTYREFQEWCEELETPIPDQVTNSYTNACQQLNKLKPYEDALSKEGSTLEEYKSYIQFVKSDGNPARVQCVYERAIQENCLIPELWLNYTLYLDTQLKIGEFSLRVFGRAVRNCPWSSQLWINYLRSLERYQQPHDKVKDTLEKALGTGASQASDYKQLWEAYLDYLRRRIDWSSTENQKELSELRNTLQQAINYMAEFFGVEGDPNCGLEQYWAYIEAEYCKNMEKAREIWNGVMSEGHSKEAHMWLEYYNMEKKFGESKHCRRLLQKAVNSCSDWPESIHQAYLDYERKHGTLEQFESALSRVESQMAKIQERREKEAQKEEERQKKTQRYEKKVFVKPEQKTGGATKRKAGGDGVFKVPSLPGQAAASSETAPAKMDPPKKKARVEESPPPTWIEHNTEKDKVTIFVKNLSFDLDEQTIREAFSKCGEIVEIRMIKNSVRGFKGYCYIEFKEEIARSMALKMDREKLNGRPMYVEPSVDRSKQDAPSKFKWSLGLEKSKLFIANLPQSSTNENLVELFGKYGELKSVRIVTYRSGQSKGLAYVEYHDEEEAKKAVLGADNTLVDGHHIKVSISNPPARKPKREIHVDNSADEPIESSSRGFGPRGKGRTQLAFMPRAINKRKTSDSQPTANTSSQKPKGQKMSNADFAKFFSK